MSNTYSNLKFEIIEVGGNDGTWGPIVNTNVGTAIEQAIVGMATLATGDFTSNVCTLTLTNTNAAQNARAACLNITATLSAAGTLNVPAIEKPYIVINNSVGGYAVTIKVSGQTGVAIPNGKACIVYNNGTDVVAAITHLTSLTLATALPVASGGTGQTSYTDGQLLIGNSTGNTLTKSTLTAGSGVTITNSSGGITIAATGSGGTVTGVTASSPLASSGGSTPNISITGAVPASTSLTTTNFTIEESGGNLIFKYGATTIASMTSAGVFTTLSDITGNGTP